MTDEKPKRRQGFAVLSPEERSHVARLGGKAVKPENRSFSKNKELAQQAGRKGGMAMGSRKSRRPKGDMTEVPSTEGTEA